MLNNFWDGFLKKLKQFLARGLKMDCLLKKRVGYGLHTDFGRTKAWFISKNFDSLVKNEWYKQLPQLQYTCIIQCPCNRDAFGPTQTSKMLNVSLGSEYIFGSLTFMKEICRNISCFGYLKQNTAKVITYRSIKDGLKWER